MYPTLYPNRSHPAQAPNKQAPTSPSGQHARPPRIVLWTAGITVGGLVLGAVYLMIVRGDALLLDLSAFSKYVLCF